MSSEQKSPVAGWLNPNDLMRKRLVARRIHTPSLVATVHSPALKIQSACVLLDKTNSLLKDAEKQKHSSTSLPVDFRLCSKIRITTTCCPLVAQHEHGQDGMLLVEASERAHALRIVNDNAAAVASPLSSVSVVSQLLAATATYVFPYIPWMRAYPRLNDSQRRLLHVTMAKQQQHGVPSLATLGKVVTDSLMHDWQSAFESVYVAVRHGTMPYFYMLTPSFSVLFANMRKANASESTITATLTPTSVGLRFSMREQGIVFESQSAVLSHRTSPNGNDENVTSARQLQHSNSCLEPVTFGLSPPPSDVGDKPMDCESTDTTPSKKRRHTVDDGVDVNDEDHISWLTAMGASPSISRKLRRIASHSDTTRHMMAAVADSTSQSSTVVVRGERNVHALYNYLHECKLTHSLTGTDAGLPPTLLAPAPFEHATVQLAKITVHAAKVPSTTAATSDDAAHEYALEVTGGERFGLMPHVVQDVLAVLRRSLAPTLNAFTVQLCGRQSFAGMNTAMKCEHDEWIFSAASMQPISPTSNISQPASIKATAQNSVHCGNGERGVHAATLHQCCDLPADVHFNEHEFRW